jgi:hypothetical protein
MYSTTLSSTSALDGVGGHHAPVTLPLANRPGTHRIGGRMGTRAGLEGSGKSRPPPGFDPWTVQPVASRYTGPPFLHQFHPSLLSGHEYDMSTDNTLHKLISWVELKNTLRAVGGNVFVRGRY